MGDEKDPAKKPQRLSEGVESAPHIDRRATIVSTFLEHGEDKNLNKGEYDEVARQRRHVYGRSKSWLEYWDDRQNIYKPKPIAEIDQYEPSAFERLIALLAYLPTIVFFLPIVMATVYKNKPKPAFMTFHIKQGFNLMLTGLFFSLIYGLTIFLIHTLVPDANVLLYLALSAVWLFPMWLMAAGISSASKGKWKALPLIGKTALLE